jgi:hypothetical protein
MSAEAAYLGAWTRPDNRRQIVRHALLKGSGIRSTTNRPPTGWGREERPQIALLSGRSQVKRSALLDSTIARRYPEVFSGFTPSD